MLKKARGVVGGVFGFVRGKAGEIARGALALAGVVAVAAQEKLFAAESVTIPDMPVDFGDIATKGAVVLGAVVAGCIGIFVITSLINMGIKWIRRAFTS